MRTITRIIAKKMVFSQRLGFAFILLQFISINSLYAGNLKGYVRDSATGEALIGATVAIKGTTTGTITNQNGFYEIPSIKEGEHIIVASYIGYLSQEITLFIGKEDDVAKDFGLVSNSYDIQEVVVTVQARGQLSAINQQLNSNAITNNVAAERLQEVPDATAAESLGRLPGVVVQSNNGEGDKVIIRGMEPRFNLITVNGVRAPSADENEGSVGLAGISPFMIEGISVQKSLTPDKDGDVVGGIVDLKLKKAEQGFKANVIFQNNISSIVKSNFNPRGTLQLGNRFFNNKLGVILVGNYENLDRSSERMDVTRNQIEKRQDGSVYINLRDAAFWSSMLNRERYGASLFMDYKLTNGSITANSFINGLNNKEIERTFAFSNRSQIRRNVSILESNTLSMINSLKFDHKLFWNSTLEVSGAWSKATSETPIYYSLGQSYLTPPSNVYVLPSEIANLLTDRAGTVYPYEMSRVANTLPDSSFFISSLSSADNTFIEDEWTAQLDWEFPLNVNDQISGSIKVGSKYRVKNREYDASDRGTGLTGGDAPQMRASIIALNPDIPFSGLSKYVGQNLPTYNILGDYDEQILDNQFKHRGFVDPSYVRQIISSMDDSNWEPSVTANTDRRNLPDDYSGNESTFAGYAMSELNLTKYLLLVGGVRYEKIKTNYKSFGITEFGTADFQIREFDDDMATRINSFLLPMINAKIMPVKWINVRLAYTQSIATPRYYSYMPRYRLTRLKAIENIGNPALKPALSHNFDAYVSFINANETRLPTGIFTIGAFYKRIEGYEFVKSFINVADSVNKNHPYYPQVISDNRSNPINVPINNPYDAYSRGIEIDYQTSFWYLPKPFNGLVLNTNYTYTETEQTQIAQKVRRETDPQRPWITIRTEVFDTLTTQQLFNQPNHTFNASLGYDYKGFSARVAYFRRSRAFIGFNDSAGGGNLPEHNRHSAVKEVWDLSLTQKIPWVDGLQFFFNMSNITESFNLNEYIEKSEGGQYPLHQEYFGRTTIIGFRYKL